MAKAKFYIPKVSEAIGTLSPMFPDERPITAVSVVENLAKCPEGFFPVLKTYDEDCDADLWRQPVIFGKRTARYLCLSKSQSVSILKVCAIRVTQVGESLPSGFTSVSLTSDTNRPAWRRKQICYRLTADRSLDREPPLTDIIVCSRLKKAPAGFQYAGEINGMLICYKTNDARIIEKDKPPAPNRNDGFYENVNDVGPSDASVRALARPLKESASVTELNKLNIQNGKADQISPDYEILNPSYGLQPTRSAPPAPNAPPVPPRLSHGKNSNYASNSYTLGNWNSLDGIKFILNPKLEGFSNSRIRLPIVRKKTLSEINKEYSYDFIAERQT